MIKGKTRNLLAAVAAVIITLCFAAAFMLGGRSAHAQNAQPVYGNLLPARNIECTALSTPKDACFFNGNYAIIVDEGQTIRVFTADGREITLTGFSSLKQIKFLDNKTLFVLHNGMVYSISIESGSREVDLSKEKTVVGCNYFDFNDKYFITVFSETLYVYESENIVDGKHIYYTGANGDYPIAINSDGDIFYHDTHGQKIEMRSAANLASSVEIPAVAAANTTMAANDGYLYFIGTNGGDRNIYRVSLPIEGGKTPTQLTINKSEYDLGNLKTPTSISLKGDNLLITDSTLSAVQEFSPKEDELVFTGFAIASGKTAYNRIAANAKDIERFGQTVAVLDNNKLTIIDASDGFDTYSTDRFVNLFKDSAPQRFALGNGTLVYVTDQKAFALLDHKKTDDTRWLNFVTEAAIKDVCYQSGFYYILTADGDNSYVYKVFESDFTQFGEKKKIDGLTGDIMTVDVFGNMYVADQTNVIAYNGDTPKTYPRNNMQKLACDLAGVLFGVSNDGKLYYYNGGWQALNTPNDVKIKSFALDFDRGEIYYITPTTEFVHFATGLGNLSVADAAVPHGFLNRQANSQVGNLEFYTVLETANVYSVNYGGGNFEFASLLEHGQEYVFIDKVQLESLSNGTLTLYALAGQSGVVLVDEQLVKPSDKTIQQAPSSVFVATDVNLYHLPIITSKDIFTALSNDNAIRLSKGTQIAVSGKIDFLGISYYMATAQTAGGESFGFVPCKFTADVLTENLAANVYTIGKTYACTLYRNEQLTEELVSLEENSEIRIFSSQNDVYLVAYYDGGQFVTGYVRASDVKNDAKITIRNVLIILAVMASVCGTSTYFILRKKSIV